jgi:hypothetical protein
MKHPMARAGFLLLVITLIPLLCGCGGPPPVSGRLQLNEERSQKLMAMAAREAEKIGDADMRLTRQLNLADAQIQRDWTDNAKSTLAAARKTMGTPEAAKLNDHARLSGWVSISELSRRIDDMATAAIATQAALGELDKIEDLGKRCEYVMGISNELQYIKGKAAAAGLLTSAGPWTQSIDNLAARRQALIAFSAALFNLDDFDAGQKMLAQEPDAAWRSDVLASMAQMPAAGKDMSAAAVSSVTAPQSIIQPFYGKSLDYEQVFKNQTKSNTSKD